MRYFARLDGDGLPTGWGIRTTEVPEGTVEVNAEVYAALPGLLFDGTEWQPRPTVAWHAETAEGLVIAALPAGAVVTVEDAETGEVLATLAPEADGSADIALPDPGPYAVTVTAPAPWLPWTLRVTR